MTCRRIPLALGLLLCAFAAPARAGDKVADSGTVRGVVELFTSQGCSSCPPADRILTKLAVDPGIVALAYHVDYWDYIGWKDTLGSAENTKRQRSYAEAFSSGTIYTPQAVVNGRRDVIGSRSAQIESALVETALTPGTAKAGIGLMLDERRLRITVDARSPPSGPAPVLMLVTFSESTATRIDEGENEGMTLVNSHAVRDWRVLGMWDGASLEIDIPVSALKSEEDGKTGCAAILQSVTESGAPGEILAAASLEF